MRRYPAVAGLCLALAASGTIAQDQDPGMVNARSIGFVIGALTSCGYDMTTVREAIAVAIRQDGDAPDRIEDLQVEFKVSSAAAEIDFDIREDRKSDCGDLVERVKRAHEDDPGDLLFDVLTRMILLQDRGMAG